MIDQLIFSEAMSVLADRFNRPLHPATIRKYHDSLSRELSTEEFVAAADLAFRDSSFWPSPRELIEYIKPLPDLNLEAASAFDRVLALGKYTPHGTSWLLSEVREDLGLEAAEAFSAIGAQGRLRNISTDDLPWARREFIAAYRAAASQRSKHASASHALELAQPRRAVLSAGSGQ
jgi:hypothetical protein